VADDGEASPPLAAWRPGQSLWDPALAEEILETVAVAPRSMEWLCEANPHWPCAKTIRTWKAERPEFRNAFNQARRELADVLAFQSVEIADDGSGDARVVERKDGSTFVVQDQEFAARSKLRTEVRRWLAGKLAPDVYGDRLDVNARLGPLLTQEEALDQLR
jgi:hypothetical protein